MCGERRIRWYGCGQTSCAQPGCRDTIKGKRGKRVFERLGALEDAPWAVIVLTTPPPVRGAILDRGARKGLEQAARKLAVRFVRIHAFHGVPVALGGVSLFHPCGEDESEWAPHFNVIIPLLGLLDDGDTRKGRYQLPESALDWLRAEWEGVLRDRFGYDGASNVFYEYRLTDERKAHAARYFGRGFPGWAAQLQRPRYFGTLRRSVSPLQGCEPTRWPFDPRRCSRCGTLNAWRTIGVSLDGGLTWTSHGPPKTGGMP